MTDRKLMQQALEALERCVATCFDKRAHYEVMSRPEHFVNQNITALRERLAQPEQEPVACKHSRYSVDVKEQTGTCYDCGAQGRMQFVVADTRPQARKPLTDEQAYNMGEKGGEPTEAERLLFEAWMRGHCWAVVGEWDGKTYVHATERNGEVNYKTVHTRQLWAAWRDRAALEAAHGLERRND